jgi:hypothetical protein
LHRPLPGRRARAGSAFSRPPSLKSNTCGVSRRLSAPPAPAPRLLPGQISTSENGWWMPHLRFLTGRGARRQVWPSKGCGKGIEAREDQTSWRLGRDRASILCEAGRRSGQRAREVILGKAFIPQNARRVRAGRMSRGFHPDRRRRSHDHPTIGP